MIARLLDRFLSWLELRRADRFAREAAQRTLDGEPVPCESAKARLKTAAARAGNNAGRVCVELPKDYAGSSLCTATLCTLQYWHSPCAFQTALAAKRDEKRTRKSAQNIRQRKGLAKR